VEDGFGRRGLAQSLNAYRPLKKPSTIIFYLYEGLIGGRCRWINMALLVPQEPLNACKASGFHSFWYRIGTLKYDEINPSAKVRPEQGLLTTAKGSYNFLQYKASKGFFFPTIGK